MANIALQIQGIQDASLGVEVREPIKTALETIYRQGTSAIKSVQASISGRISQVGAVPIDAEDNQVVITTVTASE